MEDDHVDRPGVEERQRLKLTGTNSSIGLIVLIPYAHLGAIQRIALEVRWMAQKRPANSPRGTRQLCWRRLFALPSLKKLLEQRAFCRPGGYGGAAAPDPIPNSAVKRSSADGTSSQDAGE